MSGGKSTILIALLSASLAGRVVYAQDAAEQDELNQFLDLLAQQTTIATKTRLNADYVPGMVSVLNAGQMQRRGLRNLWEALETLPGVQTTIDETGMRSISVRGIGELFEPSKVKLLLNGQAVNVSASATTGTLYDTPVEQIERVEFIRGPGSAIHGEFAYAGVVNVITRKSGQQYSTGFDSESGVNLAALYSYASADGGFKSSINFAASDSDGEDIDSGLDASLPGNPGYSPGPINNKRDSVSAIVDLDFDGLNALIQFQESNRGDHYGSNNLLPPDDKQTVISESLVSATLRQAFSLNREVDGEWSLSLLETESEKNELFLGVAEAFGGFGNEDDIVADSLIGERRWEARLELSSQQGRHKLFGALVFTDIEVTESEQFVNLDPVTNLPASMMNEFPAPVDDSLDRSAVGLVLQDEFDLDERITLTGGLRYDDYEDIGDNLSPRLALVWRYDDNHIFKSQVARAFRPPSLIETGGSIQSSIDPETNDTFELGHIYNSADLVLRNTVYYTQLEDLIVFQDFAPFGYRNSGRFYLRGYELEIETNLAGEWQIIGSLSLQDYGDDELTGAAPWMLKAGVGYQPFPLTTLNLQLNSIAERERESGDPRSDFEQTTQLDANLRARSLFDVDGLDFSLGVKNLLDERLKYPAPAGTYRGDYPYSDGALIWAQFTYQP